MADLSIQLAPSHPEGLKLANPIMTASGTFGYGDEYGDVVDIEQLGAIVCKGTTLKPRNGNKQPRLIETASGLLNSIGLQNIGVDALVKEKAPVWARWTNVKVIVNIAGESIDDYALVAAKLDGVAGISGIEVNISCPNVASGGMEFGTSPEVAARVTAIVKKESSLPVIVKLSPNVTDILEIALAVAEAGADALTLINTLRGMAINASGAKPALGNIIGGLSGPAIKPVALYMVYKVASVVKIPVIGCGGISCTDDALEFIMAGATAVQVGTATFNNPQAALNIRNGLEKYMNKEGITKLDKLIGTARK